MASSAPPPTAWPMVADQWLDAESFEDPPAIGETDMIDTTPCSFTTAQWERLCIIKELLEDVATVLEAHNLPYFLFGGTLLGAYRHGDIIPYDVQQDAQRRQFTFKRGYLPASCDFYYDPIAKYLRQQRRAEAGRPQVKPTDATQRVDVVRETNGYFSRARRLRPDGSPDDVYVDIFHLVPVELDGHRKLSDTCATWVYDESDYFPLRPCTFGGRKYWAPRNARKHLIFTYHDLRLPGRWDPAREERVGISYNGTKFVHITPESHPWRQQMVEGEDGALHLHLPAPVCAADIHTRVKRPRLLGESGQDQIAAADSRDAGDTDAHAGGDNSSQ